MIATRAAATRPTSRIVAAAPELKHGCLLCHRLVPAAPQAGHPLPTRSVAAARSTSARPCPSRSRQRRGSRAARRALRSRHPQPSRSARRSPRICAAAPVGAQVGCEDEGLGDGLDLAAAMNFGIAARQALRRVRPPALTLKRLMSACAAGDVAVESSPVAHRLGARRQRVLREALGTAPRPVLLGPKTGPARRLRGRGEMSLPNRRSSAGAPSPTAPPSAPCWRLPGTRRADDLACRTSSGCRRGHAELVLLPQRQARAHVTSTRARPMCCSCGGSAPIIRRDRLALLSLVGSTSPVTLPPRSTVQLWQSARISSSLWLM